MKNINLNYVKQKIKNIKAIKDDAEMAHITEDELYETVLKEVVKGNPEAVAMAKVALTSQKIGFSKWYS